MRNTQKKLPADYLAALSAHLDQKSGGNGDRAQGLGRVAVACGLATRDLALMHEQAMVALVTSPLFTNSRHGAIKRAGYFFTQALIPLEAAQRATRVANQNLQQRNETLRVHTAALAAGNRRLEREIAERKNGEMIIRKGKERYQKLFAESHLMQKKLRELTRQIISAQEEERKFISRELHDEVVQTLVGINVELSALGKGAAQSLHAFKSKIVRAQRLVENSVSAVHRFARELRPAALDDLGLIPALHAYGKNLAERNKLRIQMTFFGGVEALGIAERTVLYRVAQETLTNVVRHAHATEIRMIIRKIAGAIRMEIRDNGKSFRVQKTLSANTNKRLGLLGMRERVEMVRGRLTIMSAPGHGTTVCAEIPFKQEKAKI